MLCKQYLLICMFFVVDVLQFKNNFEKDRERCGKMRIVLTIVGKDKVGIIATVSQKLAENSINILNINQNILDGFFNMVMLADITNAKVSLQELQNLLKNEGDKLGVDVRVQHEDIFLAMHRI